MTRFGCRTSRLAKVRSAEASLQRTSIPKPPTSVCRVGSRAAPARLLRQGRRARLPTEDALQLGGDFVIGVDGALVWGHWSDGPDDRPAVDELIAAVAAAR